MKLFNIINSLKGEKHPIIVTIVATMVKKDHLEMVSMFIENIKKEIT